MFAKSIQFAVATALLSTSVSAFTASLTCDYDFRGSNFRIEASRIVREISSPAREYQRGGDNSVKTWSQIVVRHSNLSNRDSKSTNFAVSVLPETGLDLDGNPGQLSLTYSPKSPHVNSWTEFTVINKDHKNRRRISVNVNRQLVSIFEQKEDGIERKIATDVPATCKKGSSDF